MLFNSYIFIFIFFPTCLIGYFLLNKIDNRLGKFYLLLMSFWFYGYDEPVYLFILVGSIVTNFLFSKVLGYTREKKSGKYILALALCLNVGLIFYYKYFHFFLWNVNTFFHTNIEYGFILLPLGISFFTIQQISFVIDAYKGETRDYSFLDYAVYVSYFPQLVAGPIVLHKELIPQLQDQGKWKIQYENLFNGFTLFTLGLAKKVLIADAISEAVNWGYANVEMLSSMDVLVVFVGYSFQLYFDFSGYSDMATGMARMFNFELPINFDSPLKALSIAELWRRWHMTLTRFFTQYVYIPLGGNRKGKARTYINVMILFLISGIWHGANYTFIGWGLMHGLAMISYRMTRNVYDRFPKVVRWFLTFSFFVFSFGLFRAEGVKKWLTMMNIMIGGRTFGLNPELIELLRFEKIFLDENVFSFLVRVGVPKSVSAFGSLGVCLFIVLALKNNIRRKFSTKWYALLCTAILFCLCAFSLGSVSDFLYFNF